MTVVEGRFGQPRVRGRFSHLTRAESAVALPVSIAEHRAGRELGNAVAQFTDVGGNRHADAIAQRLIVAATQPATKETWHGFRTIVLNPRRTVWMALLEHTDFGETAGPTPDYSAFQPTDDHATGWRSIPTTEQVRTALVAEARAMTERGHAE